MTMNRPASVLDPVLRARVADFLVDYAHAIDDDRLEEWPSFFTDDALYHITTRESEAASLPIGIMHCQGRGMLSARTNFTITRTMQDGGGEAFAIGKYLDEIVVDGETLALRSRRVVLESRRIDVLLVIPI
jgi:anthranilate 1,2-dioxygenase small subunit